MLREILLYVNVIICVQAIILLVELLVNFKTPGPLKTLLLLFSLGLILRSSGHFYTDITRYNRWLIELPGPFVVSMILIFFSLLYQHRIKKYITVFLGFMLCLQLLYNIYYSFYLGIDSSISPAKIQNLNLFRSVVRLFFVLGMFSIFIDLFFKINRKYTASNIYHKKLRGWSMLLSTNLFFVFLFGIYVSWFGTEVLPVRLFTSILTFSIVLTITFRPKFLNNSSLEIAQRSIFNLTEIKGVSSSQFVESFFSNLYYLNPQASLDNFAKELDLNTEDVYRYVYTNYKIGFNDLINKNRVAYFIDLVNSKKFLNYTIDALAQEAGFSSRHHLYRPFKKFHGGTPSDFMRSIKN